MAEDWHYHATKAGHNNEYDMWNALYVLEGASLHQLARRFHVTYSCIRGRLRKANITRSARGGNHPSLFIKAVILDPLILKQETEVLCQKYKITKQTVTKARKSLRDTFLTLNSENE